MAQLSLQRFESPIHTELGVCEVLRKDGWMGQVTELPWVAFCSPEHQVIAGIYGSSAEKEM